MKRQLALIPLKHKSKFQMKRSLNLDEDSESYSLSHSGEESDDA